MFQGVSYRTSRVENAKFQCEVASTCLKPFAVCELVSNIAAMLLEMPAGSTRGETTTHQEGFSFTPLAGCGARMSSSQEEAPFWAIALVGQSV